MTTNGKRQKYCSRACYFHLTPVERFWSKVEKTETCWLWRGTLAHFGHGVFSWKVSGTHHTYKAHRFAWELANGPIPDGLSCLHRCDVACCVRVDGHLFLGTQADNMRDMVDKGRKAIGERCGNAYLTADQVRAIRASTDPQCKIARDFGTTQSNVHLIRARKNWRWLE